MNFLQKLLSFLKLQPRATSDILDDMNNKAAELRRRAEFDQQKIEKNEERARELEEKNNVHKKSMEHAKRVANRVSEFTA